MGSQNILPKQSIAECFFKRYAFPQLTTAVVFSNNILTMLSVYGLALLFTLVSFYLLVRVMCSIDLPTNKTVTTSKLVPFCCSTKQGHTACQIKLFSNYKRYRDVEARKKKDTDKRMI